MPFRDLSMSQYEDTLAGVRTFPYQWRVLAFWMVRAGTMVAPIDPHLIDAAIKTLALAASAALLYAFSATLDEPAGRGARDGDVSLRDRGRIRIRRLRDLFHQRLSRDPFVLRGSRRASPGSLVAGRARGVRGGLGQGDRDARSRSSPASKRCAGADRGQRRSPAALRSPFLRSSCGRFIRHRSRSGHGGTPSR